MPSPDVIRACVRIRDPPSASQASFQTPEVVSGPILPQSLAHSDTDLFWIQILQALWSIPTLRSSSDPGPSPESTPGVVTIPPIVHPLEFRAPTRPLRLFQSLRSRQSIASASADAPPPTTATRSAKKFFIKPSGKPPSPESADTRTIVIGWRGMSQLCRMTPKNCKINTQRLIRKLALEVLVALQHARVHRHHLPGLLRPEPSCNGAAKPASNGWCGAGESSSSIPRPAQALLPICAHTY